MESHPSVRHRPMDGPEQPSQHVTPVHKVHATRLQGHPVCSRARRIRVRVPPIWSDGHLNRQLFIISSPCSLRNKPFNVITIGSSSADRQRCTAGKGQHSLAHDGNPLTDEKRNGPKSL
ncbi:hypothetical protein BaRGS_00010194 [Batillaria attramentaria]|uniref:Uncharacterized protein n=1 Tax=Batillaria attramentaria TaxID=370345 RepID=A0ABD0LHR4_9CAEN